MAKVTKEDRELVAESEYPEWRNSQSCATAQWVDGVEVVGGKAMDRMVLICAQLRERAEKAEAERADRIELLESIQRTAEAKVKSAEERAEKAERERGEWRDDAKRAAREREELRCELEELRAKCTPPAASVSKE